MQTQRFFLFQVDFLFLVDFQEENRYQGYWYRKLNGIFLKAFANYKYLSRDIFFNTIISNTS